MGGIVYELILGTAASYLFGDAVVAFSLATGVTLFGMGVGSLLAARLAPRAGYHFVRNELVVSAVGGCSVLALYAAFALTGVAWLVFVLFSLVIGVCIGVEIPLLVSLVKNDAHDSVDLLSKVLALDYFGALVASLLFPFLLLPHLGLLRTSFAVGLLNAAVALFIVRRLRLARTLHATSWVLAGVLVVGVVAGTTLEGWLITRAYPDPVVHSEQSRYQRIVVTQYRDDTRLYLNDQLQFSSLDEARYHETLTHLAMTSVPSPRRVAILGGGDGLVAREVLRYPSVQRVDLVDIDPAVTDMARTYSRITAINERSLDDPRVQVHNTDAFAFVQDASSTWDVIVVDLIDPSNERVAKMYSLEFYRTLAQRLTPSGVFVTQATSTFFTPNAFWTIDATVAQAGGPVRTTVPASVNVPSFGEWGFVMSVPSQTVPLAATPLPSGLRYVNAQVLSERLDLPADYPGPRPDDATVSTLLSPTVTRVYNTDMQLWRYGGE